MPQPLPAAAPGSVVTLRIAARAPDLDTFVRRFGPHLHGDRFFIVTRSPRPLGTLVRFVLELESGAPILQGEGEVVRVEAEGTAGMEIRFLPLDDRSRAVLAIVERTKASARAPKPPPLPASVRRPPIEAPEAPVSVEPAVQVPANPLGEISDGDLEYFVDWSVEQVAADSPAADREPALYAEVATAASTHKARRWAPLAYVLAGAVAGGALVQLVRSESPRAPATAATLPRPKAAPPAEAIEPEPSEPEAAPEPVPEPTGEAAQLPLEITTQPRGARIELDGKPVGRSPLRVAVSAGPHELKASHPRYAVRTETVEAPGKVTLKLARPSAILDVQSSPVGANVKIRGGDSGKTPFQVELAAYKRYKVEVSLDGRAWKKTIYLKPPSTALVASLARR